VSYRPKEIIGERDFMKSCLGPKIAITKRTRYKHHKMTNASPTLTSSGAWYNSVPTKISKWVKGYS
jgi:hypothetical protein